MTKQYGLFVLGRPTFDVEYAHARAAQALAALDANGVQHVGGRDILFDNGAADTQIASVANHKPDGIIVIQATFTDAEAIVRVAGHFDAPIHIWALPEPRTGGRLRLNAFCGLNLAAHALGLRDKAFVGLYADPEAADISAQISDWLTQSAMPVPHLRAAREDGDLQAGARGVAALKDARIGQIGAHPAGFDTCAYSDEKLAQLAGVKVDAIELATLFDTAGAVGADAVTQVRRGLAGVEGLDTVDQDQLDRSLRLKSALEQIKAQGDYSGFAIRCWPETFTEYGGAVCGPVAMMGEKRTPCACEADVYGALTSLMLQEIAQAPVFLADIVDMDDQSDTTVVWHCGQAPREMADPQGEISATIHTNRKMPLLFQFALKPGRVTLARISQARGETAMVIATGEVVEAPSAFTGTSGVVRFDVPAGVARERLLGGALEHHLALVYGDHANALEYAAHTLGLPILDLSK